MIVKILWHVWYGVKKVTPALLALAGITILLMGGRKVLVGMSFDDGFMVATGLAQMGVSGAFAILATYWGDKIYRPDEEYEYEEN